jgi:hypothetical protein
MDGRSFFDTPVDAAGAQPPIWTATPSTDSSGMTTYSVVSSSQGVRAQLEPRFTPYPFGPPGMQYAFSLYDGWKNISSDAWTAALDPDGRWKGVYGCK